METLQKGKHTVVIFDDPESLSSENYYKFTKYLLLDNSIGSSIEDFTVKHLNILYTLINNDKKEEAITQINNLRQLFFFAINEINVAGMAFACLVHSIDGIKIEDYSESGLKDISHRIGAIGFTQKELKKKQTKYRITS
jgi:hypothetical protein